MQNILPHGNFYSNFFRAHAAKRPWGFLIRPADYLKEITVLSM